VSAADAGAGVAELRKRHLKRQADVLAQATAPVLAIQRLLLQARLEEVSFAVARADAQRLLEGVPPDSRAEAQALVALFDWYGWPRLREQDD
jgi:hypothetical protein